MTAFNHDYLPKGPISKYSHTVGLQRVNFGQFSPCHWPCDLQTELQKIHPYYEDVYSNISRLLTIPGGRDSVSPEATTEPPRSLRATRPSRPEFSLALTNDHPH